MAAVTCPGCGTVAELAQVRRAAEEFCPRCDYPLFWARSAAALGVDGPSSGDDTGLRRLPGTAGRVTVAQVSCWSCTEPNTVTSTHCIRCGADLAGPPPEPVVVPPPPPPPRPPMVEAPAPPRRRIWPWVLLVVLMIVVLVAVYAAG